MGQIGKNIKSIRLYNKMSQMDLAASLSVTQQAINKWENGTSVPQFDRIQDICEEFGVSVFDILYDNTDMAFFLPIDMTDDLKREITDLRVKCESKTCTFQDKIELLIAESLSSRASGRYVVHLCVTEYEYNLFRAIKEIDSSYSINDFYKMVNNRSFRKASSVNAYDNY